MTSQNYFRYCFFALTYSLFNLYYIHVYKCAAPIRYFRFGEIETYLVYQ